MAINECSHPYPDDYGTSEISWHDREHGRVVVPCGECGAVVEWAVTA